MAVPSLKSDSPVMAIVRPGDAPSALSSATTATGSVAAVMLPKTQQFHHFQS